MSETISPARAADDLAFLQYTSGSTLTPRGVRVTHRNLTVNIEMMLLGTGMHRETVAVSWLPTHHDMGLIGDTLMPMYVGCTTIKMPPSCFLQDPRRWLRAVTRYHGTHIGAPNFGYDLCTRRINSDERGGFDLSRLFTVYCGSEPIHAPTLAQFAAAYECAGLNRKAIWPCYGLAEATLYVSGGPARRGMETLDVKASVLKEHVVEAAANSDDQQTLVNCGQAAVPSSVLILDPLTLIPCESDRVGEIWVTGPHVTEGYWDDPEATERTMRATLADGRGPFLRTGDLGFTREGDVYVTGRIKDIIIIRGHNHYPQDFEHAAQNAHPALHTCIGCAFAVGEAGREGVVLAHEIARTATAGDVANARLRIRQAVAEAHQVQPLDVVIVRWGTLPKTTSGKIRRSECRDMYLRGELTGVEGRDGGKAARPKSGEVVDA